MLVYRGTRGTIELTETHKLGRIAMCRDFIDIFDQYEYLVITDECMAMVDNRTGLGAWIDPHDPSSAIFYNKTAHPVQVMIWGGIATHGLKLPLLRCPEAINGDSYCQMLEGNDIFGILNDLFGPGQYWFQQDNAPPHKKKSTVAWLEEVTGGKVFKWAPKSPDLSVIEHCWPILKRAIRGRRFATPDDLFAALSSAWDPISDEVIGNLFSSMLARCKVCLAHGGESLTGKGREVHQIHHG
jgi:hypothetical protein